jgi:hypothetical protein
MVESKSSEAKTFIQAAYSHLNDFEGGDCGYCKGKKPGVPEGSAQWGIMSNKMTTSDY